MTKCKFGIGYLINKNSLMDFPFLFSSLFLFCRNVYGKSMMLSNDNLYAPLKSNRIVFFLLRW